MKKDQRKTLKDVELGRVRIVSHFHRNKEGYTHEIGLERKIK